MAQCRSYAGCMAGRSPSYMARQLYDLQTGMRNGAWSDLMAAAVKNLTEEDIVNIVTYTASLDPWRHG